MVYSSIFLNCWENEEEVEGWRGGYGREERRNRGNAETFKKSNTKRDGLRFTVHWTGKKCSPPVCVYAPLSLGELNSPVAMAPLTVEPQQCQHVLVMRHGDRADDGADESWWTTVPNPWDAPLTSAGLVRALETGRNLRAQFGFPIHRVVVSPFRRCVETAQRLITGLSPVDAVNLGDGNSAGSSASRIKVSIEFGMCEVMNDVAMWYHPTDRDSWGFDIKKLEASFPAGVVDFTPHRVFNELPQWGESESGAKDRYLLTICSLVDKYPEENLLFVTHGEGVKVAASTYWKEARGLKIEPAFFGYAHLKRQIVRNGDSFTANRFKIATDPYKTGIHLEPPRHARTGAYTSST